MDKGLLHHLSLTLFGVGISLSNAISAYRSLDAFSVLMVLGGIGLAVAAGRPVLNGDYQDYEVYKGNWTYLLAAGALMMIAGAALRIITLV
ncbi:MAG: hypothetical protein H8Z69_06060 [Nanohaloarchaea archaeon]|nr:hypothetical protein [Candidatus Nanohaloarchaea archaeon]